MESKLESTKFPQYRRYKNGHSYFKILSLTEFEEIKIVGKRHIRHHVVAKQYPEMVFIRDLLFHYDDFAEVIPEMEFLKNSK
jgi:hypothetical protein